MSAYQLYLPGVELVDNPQLNTKLQEIEDKLAIGFFGTADFENELLKYFADITTNK